MNIGGLERDSEWTQEHLVVIFKYKIRILTENKNSIF